MTLTTKGKSKTDQQSQIERANAKWLARDGSRSPLARDPCAASQETCRFTPKARDHSNFEQKNDRSKPKTKDYVYRES